MTSQLKLADLDRQFIAAISADAETDFQATYPDLLACFDTKGVVGLIEKEIRVNGFPQDVLNNFLPTTLVALLSKTFVALLKRGCFDQFVRVSPLPAAAQAQLDKMAGVAPVEADPEVEEENAQRAAIEECVNDYRRMDSRGFKTKWMLLPERRSVYEQAVASGRV
jgi:hypothetical protein